MQVQQYWQIYIFTNLIYIYNLEIKQIKMNHLYEQNQQTLQNTSSMHNPEQINKITPKNQNQKSALLRQQYEDSPLENNSLQQPSKQLYQENQNKVNAQIHKQKLNNYAISLYRLNQSYFTKEQLLEQKHYTEIIGSQDKNLLQSQEFTYFGGMENSMKHGWGILITKKFIYEGAFSLNNKNGKGYINYLQNKSKYYGDFSNNKPNGSGLLQYGQEYYMGDFQNGCMNGDGLWKNEKGQKYIGKWKSNKAHGYGIYVTQKSHFQGQFNNFDKHGYGIENFINGDVYKGNYIKGKPHGYGQYFWESGIVYKGNFVQGLRQGDGSWRNQIGDEYMGHFSVDHKNGYGEYKWANGNVYKGQFCQDMREGYGQMIWNDGSVYEGDWKRGLPNGKGTFKVKGQKPKHGIFQDNILVQQLPLQTKRNHRIKSSRKLTNHSQDKTYNFQRSKLYVNMPQPQLLKRRKLPQNRSSSNHKKGTSLYRTTGSTMVTNFGSKINVGSRRPSNSFRIN